MTPPGERLTWRWYGDDATAGVQRRTPTRSLAARERSRCDLAIRDLLAATADRPPHLGCFGLHEWAMVYRPDRRTSAARGLAAAARRARHRRGRRVAPDRAARTSTPSGSSPTDARPLNTLQPDARRPAALEQPGCLHAGMDLYKHAFRLTPLVCSDLVADCFELARDIRELDMRASPYDLADLGYAPVRIETAAGKQEYAAAQRASPSAAPAAGRARGRLRPGTTLHF